jgi:glutamate-1-semialdehyde 2,1-aminomutase
MTAPTPVAIDRAWIAELTRREAARLDQGTPGSGRLFERARRSLAAGVPSGYQARDPWPIYVDRGTGSRVWDVDGNEYIDYVGSWGPMILGHGHPAVVRAVQEAAARGVSFGAPTELEVEMAQLISELVPSVEVVRLVNSGTEATMSAIRLARGFTDRPKIVKFRGCYHGHEDSMLVDAGSGVATLGIPGNPGVLPALARETVTVPYNDLEGARSVFDALGDQIACVIIEPVAGNMGCIPPVAGFLEGLRELCTATGALLILDEVMTGFRVALGGAQAVYGVTPDLTTLGKVIGGGLPVGAYGGRRDIMAHMAPSGPVYQAGTLSGNPLAVTAGLTTLRLLRDTPEFYGELAEKTARVATGLRDVLLDAGVPASCHHVGGMFGLFFRGEAPSSYEEAKEADAALFGLFFHAMLRRGVYLAPSAFEAGFVSQTHTDADIRRTLEAAADSIAEVTG